MAYTPTIPHNTIRDKTLVRWVADGEDGDEVILNRNVEDVADMTLTLRDDAILINPANKGLTEQTVNGPFHFTGRVYFDGGSSASDDAVAMAIALG